MIRRHELDNSDSNECVLKIVCVLLSTGSNVQQVKYSSIVLQVESGSPTPAFPFFTVFISLVLFDYDISVDC